jgi:DNA-binding response OmpR family regulator
MTKILTIEDETNVRDNILELLAAENYEAIGATNGNEGVRLALEVKPDLIICDIMMPEMDGYDVLSELRQHPDLATVPFIFLTAKGEREDQRLGMELGADDFVTKPCTPTELIAAVQARLRKQAAYVQQYQTERDRALGLQERVQQLQRNSTTTDELLQKVVRELRDPLSNINLAIQMLAIAPTPQARDRYLNVLRQECTREISLLEELSNQKERMDAESARLLRRLNVLRS